MKVKQIVGEHKKGFRAKKYASKPKKYIEPIKPQGPETVAEEMPGTMVGKVQQVKPDGTVDIQKPSGDTTTVQATALQPGENNKLTMQVPKIQPGMEVDASKTIEENPGGAIAQVNTKSNPPMVMDNATGGSPLGVTKTGEEITPELIARSTDWQERSIQANGKTYTALYSGTRGYRVGKRTYEEITGQPMTQVYTQRPVRESDAELARWKTIAGL